MMLRGASSMLMSNWGSQNYCQLIVFTRCGIGMCSSSLVSLTAALEKRKCTLAMTAPSTSQPTSVNVSPQKLMSTDASSTHNWIPFSSESKLSFVCIGHRRESYFMQAVKHYQQFIDASGQNGELFVVQDDLKQYPSVNQWRGECLSGLIDKLCETNYRAFEAILKCGAYHKLETPVTVWPSPIPYKSKGNEKPRMISRRIEICGFLNLNDIGSPMSVSRHLILTNDNPSPQISASIGQPTELERDIKRFYGPTEEESSDDNKAAHRESACVLLHGALKLENAVALVLLDDDWYGFVYSYADSKRKANLMLTVLPPGNDVVPWLGDFRYIGTAADALPGENPQFPVKPDKRSYSQNCVVWIKSAGLLSDIQKVLRHAKKLPEKTQQFYKELNRIRRASLSLGFIELLDVLSTLFEKEINALPANASPDCSIQLSHSAIQLRKVTNRDLKTTITPVPTKFNQI